MVNIPAILDHLITNYGKVPPDLITDKGQEIRSMDFKILDPLTKLYREVEDLEQLSQAANQTYTPQQLINIALHVIKGTNDYQRALETWYDRPAIEHT